MPANQLPPPIHHNQTLPWALAVHVADLIERITGCPTSLESPRGCGYVVLRQIGDSQWEPV